MSEGFFDLQVNGFGGVDFNHDDLSAEGLHRACAAMRAGGVSGFLATIVSEDLEVMARRLRRLVRLRESDSLASEMIAGLHIEGPFLSVEPGFRGAHPLDAMLPARCDSMKYLLEAAGGMARLVTLAPEADSGMRVTKMLAGANVRVAGGHSDASMEQLRAAIEAGLGMWTHLGNGCPMRLDRHDNIIQRALSLSRELWLCFIADGAHVAFPALGNYIRAAGAERCILVTDAIAPAGLGPGRYTLGRWELDIGPDMVARAPDGSHLIGAAITMREGARNLRALGLSEDEIALLSQQNPRRALGLQQS